MTVKLVNHIDLLQRSQPTSSKDCYLLPAIPDRINTLRGLTASPSRQLLCHSALRQI